MMKGSRGREEGLGAPTKRAVRKPARPGKGVARQRLEPPQPAKPGVVCGFGARCVGVLLERMRLHLSTQRFLAARRGDRIWEASCDYAALSLERLGSRLRPGMFEQPLFPRGSCLGPLGPRAQRGARSRHRVASGIR